MTEERALEFASKNYNDVTVLSRKSCKTEILEELMTALDKYSNS